MKTFLARLLVGFAAATVGGCFTTKVVPTPDAASGATGGTGDAGRDNAIAEGGSGSGGSGGAIIPGTGGTGNGSGGATATGGQGQSGGAVGTGGSGSGGTGTGGRDGTGGVGTGGTGTGGAGTGGAGTGGAATGGRGTGGAGTGGTGTGGAATGGRGTGGAGTGGAGTGGAGTGGAGAGGDPAADLVLWYKFDESSGTVAADSSGNARNGTLTSVGTGIASFSTNARVPPGAVNLSSASPTNGGYVSIPASLNTMGATTEITIAAWVNVRTTRRWQQVFSFGNTTTSGYMFLTTEQGATTPNAPRFAITTTTNAFEEIINMTTPATLSVGAWHHFAVVLGVGSTYTGTLYIDKVATGTNTAMTLRPSHLGNTINNWIGRSQFAADPLFDGYIDDFRVYRRALTATEIAALP